MPQPPYRSASPLRKQRSLSPDAYREEAWLRRKEDSRRKDRRRKSAREERRRSKSVTDEDLEELRACFELGFGFDSPDLDQRLSDTLPALGLYYAISKQNYDTVSKSSSSSPVRSTVSKGGTPPALRSPHAILDSGDDPEMVKTRLRQWAQVVACSVRQPPC